MHVECEGTLKTEAAAFVYYAVRHLKAFDLADLNSALDQYLWPGGSSNRPPYFTENILKGVKGNMPKPGCHVRTFRGFEPPFLPSLVHIQLSGMDRYDLWADADFCTPQPCAVSSARCS
jgi:hypothetical protein